MRVIYKGPADSFNGVRPAIGAEFDLTERQLASLQKGGHRFAPADKRQKLPDPEAPAPPTDEDKALLAGETPASS